MKTILLILTLAVSVASQTLVTGRIIDQYGRSVNRAEVQLFVGECSRGWIGTIRTASTSFGYYTLTVPEGCMFAAMTVNRKQYQASFPSVYIFEGGVFSTADFILIR